MKKLFAMLLAIGLLLCAACAQPSVPAGSADTQAESAPAAVDEPAAAPTAEPTPDPQAAIDEEIGFVEDGDSAAYADREGDGLSERVMVCFDADGNVCSVKERYTAAEGTVFGEEPNEWQFLGVGEWQYLNNMLCFVWDADSISRWFGGMSREQVEQCVADWPSQMPNRTVEREQIPFGEQIYKGDGLELTLDSVGFAKDEGVELSLSAKATGNTMLVYYIREAYINGWKVDPLSGNSGFALQGVDMSQTVTVGSAASPAFRAMQIDGIQSVGLYLSVIKNGKWLKPQYTKVLVNPNADSGYAQVYDDAGTVLLDDETVKVVQRRLDAKNGRAELYIEKKDTSRWTSMLFDGVFDGYGGTDVDAVNLNPGVRTILLLDGKEVCAVNGIDEVSEIDVYVTAYSNLSVQKPVKLVIQNPNLPVATVERKARGEVVFDGDYCTIRYLGVNDAYFSNSDVILLECENKTEDRYLSVYQAFNYLLLDETRVSALMSGANCYPGSVTTMALYPEDSDYSDLSAYKEGQLKLGVYEIKNGFHNSLELSPVLTLDLTKTYTIGQD